MTLSESKKLIKDGESLYVEFKTKIRYPEKVVRELVAFANTEGGHLFVGVSDVGELIGLKYPEEEYFILGKAICELIKPKITFEFDDILLDDNKSLLHYHVHKSSIKPHFALLKKTHKWGKAYVRVNDRSVQASKELRKIMKCENKESKSFQVGAHERLFFKFLDNNPLMTLRDFSEATNIGVKEASEIVVRLASSNVIKVIPSDKQDHYVFNQ